MSLAFFLTSLVIVLAPGVGVIYTMSAGLAGGWRASIFAALGCTLGILPHLLAAVLGLSAVMHASAVAFQSFKYLGVAYLLFLAWNTLRSHEALNVEAGTGGRSFLQLILKAVLVNSLNPKLPIFFIAFLPQFVSANDAAPMLHMLELSGVFMAMTLVVFTGYGMFAAALRDHVISRPRVLAWMRRSFAGAFVALGVKLALSEV